MPIVYLATNIHNGKRYVGKTKTPLPKRWAQHVYEAARGSVFALHRAIRKYGPDSFRLEELGTYLLEEDSLKAERFWIVKLRTIGAAVYNMCAGGRGTIGYRHTREAKARMRDIAIAKGQTPSALALRRSAEARTGTTHSAETLAKMRESQARRRETPVTDEFREKCRLANVGKRVGVKATDEARRKMTESQRARWSRVARPAPKPGRGTRLEGPAIDRILELHKAGVSLGHIVATLTAEGVATYKGGRWARTTVSKLLAHYAPHLKQKAP